MKKLFLITAVATMFAACNNEELAPVVDEMTNTPIALHAGVAELVTRAGYPTGDLTSGSLGFIMITSGVDENNSANSKYFSTNKEFTYVDATTGWTPADNNSLLWWNATSAVNYIAYYPYSSAVADKAIEIEVPTIQTNENVVDFLCTGGTTTGTQSADGINLNFDHMMTKLNITLTAKSEFTTTPEFAKVTIVGLKNKCKFKFNAYVKSPEYEWDTPDANLAATDVTMIKNSDNEFEAIVIPQTVDAFVVEIIADNRTFRYTQENVTLSAGTSYELNLEVGKDKANIKSATVKEWTSDNTTLTGENGTDEIIEEPKYELKDNTYFVENGAGLQEVARQIGSNSSANITLVNDIYLPKPAEGASNWTPISHYSGHFDGNGKKITGMVIVGNGSGAQGNYQGFIKELDNGGIIKNLTLVSASVSGCRYCGCVVGKTMGGTIINCHLRGNSSVSGLSDNGGIVGANSATDEITYISSTIGCTVSDNLSVIGNGNLGGVVGLNEKGAKVIACLASGVSGANGGLVGDNNTFEGPSAIIGCYAYQCNNLSGNANICGNGDTNITACYYTPTTDGTLTAYNGSTDDNWETAVTAMNNAIDGATLPAGADKFHWGGTQSEPTLTKQ